jgi:hypothetical protein
MIPRNTSRSFLLVDMLKDIFVLRPAKRLTAERALAHLYFELGEESIR